MIPRALTDEQELALVQDHSDGWRPTELTIMYKVSIRTVYRTLAKHDAGPTNPKKGGNKKRKKKKRPELKPCGTNAAYVRHKKKGEYPCTPGLAAHAADVKTYKEKSK